MAGIENSPYGHFARQRAAKRPLKMKKLAPSWGEQ
jgi:hypothetical protein